MRRVKNGAGCQPLDQDQLVNLDDVLYINPGSGSIVQSDRRQHGVLRRSLRRRRARCGHRKPIIVLRLVGGNFRQVRHGQSHRPPSAQAKKTPVRRLWGKGKGRFRTRGRYSSGTVRGTNWITTDYCDGTDTRVVAASCGSTTS